MTRTTLVIIFLLSSFGSVFPNPRPPDPYTELGITEVYIPRSDEWYIELDGKWCLYDNGYATFPCSSDLYLGISGLLSSSTKRFYQVRVKFANNGYGVISRSSLIGINKGTNFSISYTDTVIIARDTAKTSKFATPQGKIRCWKFPLRMVSTGNSLVAMFMKTDTLPDLYSTSRRSIGYTRDYKTTCYLTVLDQHNEPVTEIYARGNNGINISYGQKSGLIQMETAIHRPKGTVTFNDPFGAHPYSYSWKLIPEYPFQYNDKDSLIYDTLRLNMTKYMVKVIDDLGKPVNGINFFYKYTPAANDPLIRHCKLTPLPYEKLQTWHFRIYESIPVETLSVAADINTLCTENSIDNISFWSGSFRDTADTIFESVIVDPVLVKRQKTLDVAPMVGKFSVLIEGDRSLLLIFTSPHTFPNAIATLYTINGKMIKSVSLDIHPGTNTFRFTLSDGNELAKGTYLCKLGIGGHTTLSQRVVVK